MAIGASLRGVNTKEGTRVPEPGEVIAAVMCPCCGAELSVMHGEEEGEIVVEGVEREEGDLDVH